MGRLIGTTDPLNHSTTILKDNLDQVITTTNPLQGVTAFAYDPNGNLLSLTDPLNHVTSYAYNNMDRVASRSDPLKRQETYGYDLNGNLLFLTDRKGQVTTYTYDALNRPNFVGFGTLNHGIYASTVTYQYDAGNRLIKAIDSIAGTIQRGYDGFDHLASENNPQGSISYTYDAAGRPGTMQVAGQPLVNYTFDNANRLTQLSQGSNAVGFSYDNANRRATLTLPNNIVATYSYDNDSHVTGISYALNSNIVGALTYGYDATGKKTSVLGALAPTNLPQTVTLASYDAANELVNWGGSPLTYDDNGNLLYDGAHTYTWDARNQLATMDSGNTGNFAYDAFGRRASKSIYNAPAVSYFYDRANIVQELSGTTPTANLVTGGIDEHFMRTDSYGGRSFLTDAIGSTVALMDSTGTSQTQYNYEPFGNTTVSGTTSASSFQYTGRENDGAGLYFYRARYYNPTFQRFISEDPVQFLGGINSYSYALGDPINNIDPSGNVAGVDDLVLAGGGALVGLGIQAGTDILRGNVSDWQQYAGAAFGGAVGGLAIEYTGGLGTGALAAGTTNGVSQALEVLSGKQCGFHPGEFLANIGLGGLFGALPDVPVPAWSSGRNNWNAIGKTIRTKLANGTIENVSAATAAKALVGANAAGAAGTALGVSASVALDAAGASGQSPAGRAPCGCK